MDNFIYGWAETFHDQFQNKLNQIYWYKKAHTQNIKFDYLCLLNLKGYENNDRYYFPVLLSRKKKWNKIEHFEKKLKATNQQAATLEISE